MRFVLAMLAVLGLALPAHASFTLCNRSAHPTKAAIGRFNGAAWQSEGWWTLKPHQCQVLLPGRLDARYYYLYASDGGSGAWGGRKSFCVTDQSRFEAVGRGDCAGRGMDRKGFFEVDTGEKVDFTQSLSD